MQTLELDGTRDVSLSVEVLLDYILLSPSVTRPIYGHRPCKEKHLADELFLKCDHAIFQERGRGRRPRSRPWRGKRTWRGKSITVGRQPRRRTGLSCWRNGNLEASPSAQLSANHL